MISISFSARSIATVINSSILFTVSFISSFNHNRTSVATWSLRLRPVCNFPPGAPINSDNLRSFAVCISSSDGCNSKRPSSHSLYTWSKPLCIASFSSEVNIFALSNAVAYALLPRISTFHKRLS